MRGSDLQDLEDENNTDEEEEITIKIVKSPASSISVATPPMVSLNKKSAR